MKAQQDFFALLVEDHKLVKKQIEGCLSHLKKGEEVPFSEVQNIIKELQLHARVEELYVYPEGEEISEMEDQVEDAREEHAEVKMLLKKLEEHQDSPSEISKYLQQLLIGLDHHVKEEEELLFPSMREELSMEQIQEITQKVTAYKEKQLSTR